MRVLLTLRLPIALGLVSILGIVCMLPLEGPGDFLAFILAALPLIAGVLAWQRGRGSKTP